MDSPLESVAICEQVVSLMVGTFDFPEAEARHRINLWKARQHQLEGQALEAIIPHLSPEEKAQELIRWVLEGDKIEADLRQGAKELDIEIDPSP